MKPRNLYLLEVLLAVAGAFTLAFLAAHHADLLRVLSAWPWFR